MKKSLNERIYSLIGVLSGTLFLMLFLLNIVRIVMRYIWGISWIWIPDLSRFLFIWIVFLGAAVLVGKNEHMLMDFFLGKMKPAHRRITEIIIQIGQIPLFGVMLMSGIKITRVRMRIPFDTWDFPTGWAYLAVPVCAVIMIYFSLSNIFHFATQKRGER